MSDGWRCRTERCGGVHRYKEKGIGMRGMEEKRKKESMDFDTLTQERDRSLQRDKRWRRIRKSRFNKWYGRV